MANYFISLLAPYLQSYGQEYVSRMFLKRVKERNTPLIATFHWLQNQLSPASQFQETLQELLEAGLTHWDGLSIEKFIESTQTSQPDFDITRLFVARAFIKLLQTPVRLDSKQAVDQNLVPETLEYDSQRLSQIRDIADKISLESSILITTRQILAKLKIHTKESQEIELQHRLDVLLSDNEANLPSIVAEVDKYVQYCIARARGLARDLENSSPRYSEINLSSTNPIIADHSFDMKEVHEKVEKSIKEVISEGNPVLSLFSKRVFKITLRAILDQPLSSKIAAYSLNSKGQERNISELVSLAQRLFNHNFNIHKDLYKVLLHSAATLEHN